MLFITIVSCGSVTESLLMDMQSLFLCDLIRSGTVVLLPSCDVTESLLMDPSCGLMVLTVTNFCKSTNDSHSAY